MKKYLVLLLAVVIGNYTNAQKALIGDLYEVYAYGGMTRIFCDVNTVSNTGTGGIGFGLKVHNYFSMNFDIQRGQYKGGNKNDQGQYYMEFVNNYTTTTMTTRFYPFLIPYNRIDAMDRLYLSTGVGLHFNDVVGNNSTVPGVGFLQNNNDVNLFVPMEIGYTFPILRWRQPMIEKGMSSLNVLIGYRYNLSFSDVWDGYTPTVNANQHNDASGTGFIGLSYSFN